MQTNLGDRGGLREEMVVETKEFQELLNLILLQQGARDGRKYDWMRFHTYGTVVVKRVKKERTNLG